MYNKIGGNLIMKRDQVLLGLGALMLAAAPAAHATLLAPPLVNLQPGEFYTPITGQGNDAADHNGSNPVGTLVASTGVEVISNTSTTTGDTLSGSFISEVYQEAGGTLDFYYQISTAAGSTAAIDDLSVGSFLASSVSSPNGVNVGQTTSVALFGTSGVPAACGFGLNLACTPVTLVGPNMGTSVPVLGSYNAAGTVDWNFDGLTLPAGETSVVFVISTNNTLFSLDNLSLDGTSGTSEGTPPLFAFQPASVPEPVSLVLLGTTLALAALFIRRRQVGKVSKAEIES
jgi:hypothetical protein